jgi:hypothetical protein
MYYNYVACAPLLLSRDSTWEEIAATDCSSFFVVVCVVQQSAPSNCHSQEKEKYEMVKYPSKLNKIRRGSSFIYSLSDKTPHIEQIE